MHRSHVFLGLALEKQDKNEDSERAYDAAAKIRGDDALAWQGLVTLYEKQATKKIDEYRNAALRLAEVFMKAYVRCWMSCSYDCGTLS